MLRSMKYGLYGAVLAGLVAAPAVWNSVDKTVHLVVDGHPSQVRTTAQSVGDVLADRHLAVSSHDLLAPSASAPIHDGTRIVLRRGRLLHLDVDGRRTDVWTTAPTVREALQALGYSTSDFVSVSRARRLPLAPTDIAIRTPRPVTVVHDGTSEQVATTDATVGALLADLQIALGDHDRLTPSPSVPVTAGMTVRVQRVDTKLVTRVEALPFPTKKLQDGQLSSGVTKIITAGRAGRARITYSVVYVDGEAVGRTRVDAVTLRAPTPKVVKIGTRSTVAVADGASSPVPSAPAPSPGTAKAIARRLLAQRGWGDAQYDCLVTLWDHESGWRVHAANPSGAYGIPQALPGSKMSSAGGDWQNSAETQIKWGLGYIAGRYDTPCGAWSSWQAQGGWY